jgi:hypothetical protein
MSKRRLLNPVTTYLHLSALLPSTTIRMAALSALFHLCGYYLSLLLLRRACLVSSMITFMQCCRSLISYYPLDYCCGPLGSAAVGRWFGPVSATCL